MKSRTAARLVRLYPSHWRTRYGHEFVALLEQHPLSIKTLINVLWSAGEVHMQAAISHERNRGKIVGSILSAWMIAVIAGLILYGMVDDSSLVSVMKRNSIFTASWDIIQIGCILGVSAIGIAGLPLALSIVLHAVRERRREVSVRLAIPLFAACALIAWVAAVLISTGGHWAASPWAVAFPRPDWPSSTIRWATAAITAILLLFGCLTSASSASRLLRNSELPDLQVAFFRASVQLKPLSFAAALAPWAAVGIFIMFAGVVAWGSIALHQSAVVLRSSNGPLGLSGLASWILSAMLLGLASSMSGKAVWSNRMRSAKWSAKCPDLKNKFH